MGGIFTEEYYVTMIKIDTQNDMVLNVKVDEAEITDNIVISANVNGNEILVSNENYLPAFQEFRDKILRLGYGLKCNGSRLNVIQSGMMGACDKVYLVEPGKQALMKDVVHIWEYADVDTFPTSQEQNEYAEKWFSSLRRF